MRLGDGVWALAHILTKKVGDAQNLLLASFFSPASLRRPCEERIKTEDGAGLPLPFCFSWPSPSPFPYPLAPGGSPGAAGHWEHLQTALQEIRFLNGVYTEWQGRSREGFFRGRCSGKSVHSGRSHAGSSSLTSIRAAFSRQLGSGKGQAHCASPSQTFSLKP